MRSEHVQSVGVASEAAQRQQNNPAAHLSAAAGCVGESPQLQTHSYVAAVQLLEMAWLCRCRCCCEIWCATVLCAVDASLVVSLRVHSWMMALLWNGQHGTHEKWLNAHSLSLTGVSRPQRFCDAVSVFVCMHPGQPIEHISSHNTTPHPQHLHHHRSCQFCHTKQRSRLPTQAHTQWRTRCNPGSRVV